MKFNSKAHLAQELIAGKRFKTNSCVVIYYDEKYPNPFRHGSGEMHDMWNAYCKDIWTEVNPRHVHQDLIYSYQEGQAWQFSKGRGFKNVVDSDSNWTEPSWIKHYTYRLHPHNDLIQAYRNGANIQVYSHGEWVDIELEPCWHEDSQYRIKPVTKTIYEWMYKDRFNHKWKFVDSPMNEEEAKLYFCDLVYQKTGRYWEVEV
jgi:hypothetical protein